MPASTSAEFVCSADPLDGAAALDHAVSRALLARVAAGELDSAVRIWRPVPALAMSRLDLLRPGADDAIAIARAAGVPPIRRGSGGHAVVLGGGSLALGFAEPSHAFEGTQQRYERLTRAIVAALAGHGIHAEQGDLAGEWCPGTWSIRSGTVKLAGLAQRAIRGGAWVEAVVELAPSPSDRELTGRIYGALGLDLDPRTFGSVAEAGGAGVGFDAFAALLTGALSPRGTPDASASQATLDRAGRHVADFAL